MTKLDYILCQQHKNGHWTVKVQNTSRHQGLKIRNMWHLFHLCMDGLFLPFQVVFTNTMHKTLPLNNEGKFMYINNWWGITFSENHWSTFETTKRFVHKILLSYLHSQIKQLGLPKHKKMVWLLDCWFVHKSKEFLDWMKEDHPNILVIFIPTNCRNELQPTYVIL